MTRDEGDEIISFWMAMSIIFVVTAIWAAANIASIYSFRGYDMPESLNIAFTTIVGGVFVARSRAKSRDRDDRGGDHRR